MNLTGGGAAGPGPGTVWWHEHHGLDVDGSPPYHTGFCSRFLYNLCTTITTCAYFVCCCWLLRDCIGDPRDRPPPPPPPGPSYGTWTPAPPEPPSAMPGPPGLPGPSGPPGGPVERPFF